MKKFLYLFFLLPFGQIFAQEESKRPAPQKATHREEEDIDSQALFEAFDQQIKKGSVVGLDRLMPTQRVPTPRRGFPQPPFLLQQQAQSFTPGQHQLTTVANSFAFQMPPPPPSPFLLPPISLAGQSAQSLTDSQQQLTTGANSFFFQMPPPPPQPPFLLQQQPAQSFTQGQDQNPSIILKGMPVQPQLPPAAPVLPPASTVSIPPLSTTTVAPIRATADQNQSHEPHQVEGFSINSDGNYQCMHPGCRTIIDTVLIDSLTRHQRTHRISYQCSQCGYDGKGRQDNVKRHINSKQGKCSDAVVETVIPKESNVQVVTPDGFTKTPDGNYQCMHPHCRKKIISGDAQIGKLKRHQRMHIYQDRKKFPGAAVETVTSSSAIGDNVGNEAPFLPPFSPPPFSPPSLPTSSSAIARLPDQHEEQRQNLDNAFIAQLLSEPLPNTLGISSVTPGTSNSQESDQLPVSSAPQITQAQEVANQFGIQHGPAPLDDQTLPGNLPLDEAFIAQLLSEQSQQASTDDQSQQQPSTVGFSPVANLFPSQGIQRQPFFGQQPFTLGSSPAANFFPSQGIQPQTFFGQQPFTLGSSPAANFFPSQGIQPQPFSGQQPFTVGPSPEERIGPSPEERIRLRLMQIGAFINSDTYQNAPPHLKQKTLADFTASLDGFTLPSTQTIESATSNVSPVDLPTVSTVAALAQKKSFQCDLCEKSFASKLILKRHRASEHAPQLLQENTSGSAAREDHSTDVSATAAQSDENPDKFDEFIRRFSSTITGPDDGLEIYCCRFPACVKKNLVPKEFRIFNSFRKHMKDHLAKLKEIYQCLVCKKLFTAKSSLDRHLSNDNVHQLRLPSERSSINLSERSPINLPDKYKKHFTQEDSKIICKECGKEFPSTIYLQSLYQHKQRHQQKYQCAACEVTYFWRSNAKEHTEKDGSCKNAEIKVINLTSTAPSASNQKEFSNDDDDHDDDAIDD